MNVDLNFDDVIRLRELFAAGAAPSRLIGYIAERHSGDENWHRYVEAYFSSAFSVVILDRIWENRSGNFSIEDKTASYLNTVVLQEIVERAHLWRHTIAGEAWFDGLDVSSSELKLIDSIKPEIHPSLSESWAAMSGKSRFFVRQAMINSQSYYEKTMILARLAENLQRQVAELERQVNPVEAQLK
jgi:hypothetical protein